jgi:Protein tyrosine and serine/threonine kinase
MKLTSVELWQRISAAGLAAPMQCRTWAAEALQGLPPGDAADAEKILGELVRLGRLTDYQADLLTGRRKGEFKRGPWTFLRPVAVPLWSGWIEAVKAPVDPPLWVRWINKKELSSLRPTNPSLPRGLQQSQVQGQFLQPTVAPEMIDQQLILQVRPVRGIPLIHAVEQNPNLANQSIEIIHQLTIALRTMHEAKLIHGRVLPDRIFWDDRSGITLARDPLCSNTAGLVADHCGVIENGLGRLKAVQFIAPEFLAPGQTSSMASDIYSLGCLWWWLITGQPLVEGGTAEVQLARHIEASIALPANIDLPSPYVRCLQHCLAKNLPARFSSAIELSKAIEAAAASVAKGPIGKTAPTQSATAIKTQQKVEVKQKVDENPRKSHGQTKTVAMELKPITATSPPTISVPAPQTSDVVTTKANPAAAEPLVKAVEVVMPPKDPTKAPAASVTKRAIKPNSQPAKTIEPIAAIDPEVKTPALDVSLQLEPSTANTPISAKRSPLAEGKAENKAKSVAMSTDKLPAAEKVVSTKTKPASKKRKNSGRKKQSNAWLMIVVGGLGFVSLVLLGVLLSGIAKPSTNTKRDKSLVGNDSSTTTPLPDEKPVDPRTEAFQLVAAEKGAPWLPPALPKPITLELLPPGGQLFFSFKPHKLTNEPTGKAVLATLNDDLSPLLSHLTNRVGVPLESMSQIVVAFYGEEKVETCLRVELTNPQLLSTLKTAWNINGQEKVDKQTLMTNEAGDGFYVTAQPLSDAQSVSEFSMGPKALMKQSVELGGARGPLVSQVEKLWQATDADADFCLLLATPFLFGDGKELMAMAPKRLVEQLRSTLGTNMRAAMFQTRLSPSWYLETRLIGASDRDAGMISEALRNKITGASPSIDEWLVVEQPHPYWRPLANRFSRMLQALSDNSRFGVEGGAAIANAYLPSEATTNIVLASWIAMQPGATQLSENNTRTETSIPPPSKPLTEDEYLGRMITLTFDQEPIEVALRLVGEEANTGLPAGTAPMRFAVDGNAFEKAGITRNQPIRDYKHQSKPVRDALTEIARRGNPVTTVKDTRDADQRLIWVVRDDPEKPGARMISLTTRVAATGDSIPLPTEFAPP